MKKENLTTTHQDTSNMYLLDGLALAYRSFFAMIRTPMINSQGINTAGIYGFTTTLFELISKKKPKYIAVVLDTSAPTYRHKIYKPYKANRQSMPEDLSKSLPWIEKITKAMNIPIIKKDGYEADDIIGTIAKKIENNNSLNGEKISNIFMVTPDKDFCQLVSEKILMYKPGRSGGNEQIITIENVNEQWNVKNPSQVIDVLALWGDSADNIPGVNGVGEKTSKKLISEYGSVENLLKNVKNLKGKLKENIVKSQDDIALYKKLVTIITDVPLDEEETINKLKIQEFNNDKLNNIFQELEFNSLGKRILGDKYTLKISSKNNDISTKQNKSIQNDNSSEISGKSNNSNEIINFDLNHLPHPVFHEEVTSYNEKNKKYIRISINNNEERQKFIKKFTLSKAYCFDCETTGLDTKKSKIIGIAFSNSNNTGYYIEIPDYNFDREGYLRILSELKPLLENEKILKIAHNLKFDLTILAWNGIEPKSNYFDTMLAHIILEPDQRHKMDVLSEKFLNYKPISITTLIGEGKGKLKQVSMLDAMDDDPEKVSRYACEDADVTWQLYNTFRHRLKLNSMKQIFYDLEMKLLPVLIRTERNGIKIDQDILANISTNLQSELIELEKNIYALAGIEFNINSPKQMGEILFGRLKLVDKPKKTPTGQFKTDEKILESLRNNHDIIDKILHYRKAFKLMNTYVEALPKQINPTTKRIHTTYSQLNTVTGRIASDHPNLQNIPIRENRGREIRQAFIPEKGNVLICADYSQIELRLMAHLSKDESMIKAFKNNQDIHSATAAKVYGIEIEEVIDEMRRNAKMVNFGMIYGISAFGLSQRLNIPRKEAAKIINDYFDKYPLVKKYMEDVVKSAANSGYVESIFGRRRYLRDINSSNAIIRQSAERNAINTPIQGSAADMIKYAMINIETILTKKKFRSKMLLQVHDELVFEATKEEKYDLIDIINQEMTNVKKLSVPIVVDIGEGDNWLEAH